jgi:hypothetical protein
MRKPANLKYYVAGLISLIVFSVFIPALQNGFVWWDDNDYVFENPNIRAFDTAFFRWAFFGFHANNWHPLTWISHALDYAVWGLDPFGHHLTNIILHSLNAFVVVLLITKLAGALKDTTINGYAPASFLKDRSILIMGAVTGLLFGLHPLRVESVAWVSERKDLLCALFFLLSLMTYAKYLSVRAVMDSQKMPASGFLTKGYLLTLGFFILALLSKPMAVTLPLVLLVLDWYPFRRIRSGRTFLTAVFEKLPFIALSLAASALTVLAQRSLIKPVEFVPLSTRLFVGAKSLIVYLWKILLPLNLSPFYPYPQNIPTFSFTNILPVVLVLAITVACVLLAKREKLWLAVWLYYVISLVPVLGIVQVGDQAMADRYTYLPSLAPLLIIGLAAARISEKLTGLEKRVVALKSFAIALCIFVCGSLSYLTVRQIKVWRNSVDLFTYIIENDPLHVPNVYYNRGKAFEQEGRLDKAATDYLTAIALNPLHYRAYVSLGVLYGRAGMFEKAIEYFNKSMAIRPDYYIAYGDRGLTYFFMGQNDKALEDFNQAIELNRNYSDAYVGRGNLNLREGKAELAAPDFQTACALGNTKGCSALRALRF